MSAKPFILTIANHKGGVGKTTTAVTLATGFAALGHPTVLIDCDPQGNVAEFLGIEKRGGLYDLIVERRGHKAATSLADKGYDCLVVVPGNGETVQIESLLYMQGGRVQTKTAIKNGISCFATGRPGKRSIIILDTSPSISHIQASAITAADWLIIPAVPEYASESGINQLITMATELREAGVSDVKVLGILPTMADLRCKEHQDTIAYLRNEFPNLMLPTIRRLIALGEAPGYRQAIWNYAPDSEAAKDYGALMNEVIHYV